MGLPMYVINLDDFSDIIKQVFDTEYLRMGASIVGDGKIDVSSSLDGVEEEMTKLLETANTQAISVGTLVSDINVLVTQIGELHGMQDDEIGRIQVKLAQILAEKLEIEELLSQYLLSMDKGGTPQFISVRRNITNSKDIIQNTFDKNIILKSIFIHQSNYNFEDCWSLMINGEYLFRDIYTKFVEEHKNFHATTKMEVGDVLTFEFNNNSSEQKIINYDIEYLIIG
jgi:threonine dehydrogenase-like Zn-dependent dehydrogenase